MFNNGVIILILFLISNIGSAQSTASEIIAKSIAYHDPDGLLNSGTLELNLSETRPNGSDRQTKVWINEAKEFYKIESKTDEAQTTMQQKKSTYKFKLNGKSKISDSDKIKFRLTKDRMNFMKNYYRYLWMLPNTLKDPGTKLPGGYSIVDFFGKTCIEIKVIYDPEVGSDTWYFYFNPQTYALEGYRFYHDESANDGEYILLEGATSFESATLPKSRKWYTHKEDKYLGEDTLVTFKID